MSRPRVAFLAAWFVVDVLFAFDSDLLRSLPTSRGADGALVLGALGFSYLVFRNRYPLAVFGMALVHSLALAALTQMQYVSVFGVWLALRAVAESRDDAWRYVALLGSLAPSVLMAANLHSVTTQPATNVVVIVIAGHAVLIMGFWEDGARRRKGSAVGVDAQVHGQADAGQGDHHPQHLRG